MIVGCVGHGRHDKLLFVEVWKLEQKSQWLISRVFMMMVEMFVKGGNDGHDAVVLRYKGVLANSHRFAMDKPVHNLSQMSNHKFLRFSRTVEDTFSTISILSAGQDYRSKKTLQGNAAVKERLRSSEDSFFGTPSIAGFGADGGGPSFSI